MTLPWRFIVPRPRYFQSFKIARACPEIVSFINQQALNDLHLYAVGILWCPTVGIVRAISYGLALLAEWLPDMPDFNGRKTKIILDAWAVLPYETIQERMGTRSRILTKKDAA